jgi:hypothetical protein
MLEKKDALRAQGCQVQLKVSADTFTALVIPNRGAAAHKGAMSCGKVRLQWLQFLKLSCDSRFQRMFTACGCVFKVILLVVSNQGNYFENATACSKRTLKTRVAMQLIFKPNKAARGAAKYLIKGSMNKKGWETLLCTEKRNINLNLLAQWLQVKCW